MIEHNFFQDLGQVHCPIKGELDPVPFCHLGIEGSVPRKCTLCPYLFEGECLWQRDKKPSELFSLKITQAIRSGKDSLNEAFQEVIANFSPSPYSVRILLVMEGNLLHTTLAEIQEIVDAFHRYHQEKEFYFAVYPNSSIGEEVRVSVVQELPQKATRLITCAI